MSNRTVVFRAAELVVNTGEPNEVQIINLSIEGSPNDIIDVLKALGIHSPNLVDETSKEPKS